MLSYRVTLDVPFQLAVFVPELLAGHRREIGTRSGTRALSCWKQAIFALAWFRDRPDVRRLGQGFGISQATAYRYKDEAVQVLAAKAPSLRQALERAVALELPYLILDGTLVSADRCAGTKTSKKGKQIDAWYSGKAHRPPGMCRHWPARPASLCWSKTRPPGLTLDYGTATISAHVCRTRLSAAGDSALLARAAGAVLGVQGRGDPRAVARGRRAAPGEPEAAAVVE